LIAGLDKAVNDLKDESLKASLIESFSPYSAAVDEIRKDLRAKPDDVYCEIRPWRQNDQKVLTQQKQKVEVKWEGEVSQGVQPLKNLQAQELLAIFKPDLYKDFVQELSQAVSQHEELLGLHIGETSGKKYSKLKVRIGKTAEEILKKLKVKLKDGSDPDLGDGPWNNLN